MLHVFLENFLTAISRLHENAANADGLKTPPLNMSLGPILHEKSFAAISGGS
jgi:hypothetical protein